MLSNFQEDQSGEIREVFGVSLSGEALRPLFGELRTVISGKTSESEKEVACEGVPPSPGNTHLPSGGPAEPRVSCFQCFQTLTLSQRLFSFATPIYQHIVDRCT